MAEGVEHHIGAFDIVPKTPVAGPNPPLSIAQRHSGELLDLVLPAMVVGILLQDIEQLFDNDDQSGIPLRELPDIPLIP